MNCYGHFGMESAVRFLRALVRLAPQAARMPYWCMSHCTESVCLRLLPLLVLVCRLLEGMSNVKCRGMIFSTCLQWIGRGSYYTYFSVLSLYSKQFPQWLIPETRKWEQTHYVSKRMTTWITWSRTVPQESFHPMAASSSHPHRPFLTVTQCKTFSTLCKRRLAALQRSSSPEESNVIQHQKYQMSLK